MTPVEEIIVQGDFAAENYSYVVQDEIQSFHLENKQVLCFKAFKTASLKFITQIITEAISSPSKSIAQLLRQRYPLIRYVL